ncbi:DUF423 domain-containing protein [Gammaproteobacteria bacterium]|jgi:uncharacterized membrane protein YgdD (TMEM256/DUF423 family)|nr:DUF423 domain-containing protein [Pseudomonadales bacterium]MBT7227718.1 DUF423 domain-containing protein [Gammaproteobacteria bacterium]MDB3908465.1 DUF423 domain-containing protein [Gammaproteobacteria bacterium]MDC0414590.1 DUF423 domain-containing protein [Gammaproteobacteria bacterium]MDC3196567.1 DUF423 domain-containing protein [Gammaproteobacteria bacterium]
MSKLVIMLAGINGFLAVSLGAFAAHALRDRLSPELLNTFQTGVQYHMYHALALFGIGLMMINFPASNILRVSAYLMLAGLVFFSGSLYLLSITGIRWLGAITPIGGVFFLVAWALIVWFAAKQQFPT